MDDQDKQPPLDYVSAAQAMKILGVRPQTLYAYVSRGWIRSIPQKGLKDRLYLRDDINRVVTRSLARSGHGAVAASAMNWGEPIFPSSITEITPQGPRYRGHLAAELARSSASFEAVAELLWTGTLCASAPTWPVRKPSAELLKLAQTLASLQAGANLLESFALVVLLLGMQRGSVAERLAKGRTLPAAREIMHTVVACCGFIGPNQTYQPMRKGQQVIDGLMHALSVTPDAQNREALQTILILLADHELSPGTLSARVGASSGGSLHSCLASALCATSGVDVGRMYDQVENFLGRAPTRSILVRRARQLHENGQAVPGFEHPLYPKGDPRAAQLLELARRRSRQSGGAGAIFGFIEEMQAAVGLHARQELAVVMLTRAIGLSRQAPAALFVLGRLPGWVAHVQEQRAAATLLRPRAKFVEVSDE